MMSFNGIFLNLILVMISQYDQQMLFFSNIYTEIYDFSRNLSWQSAQETCAGIGARLPVLRKRYDIHQLTKAFNSSISYVGLHRVCITFFYMKLMDILCMSFLF